jgi:PEP-CTERM motif
MRMRALIAGWAVVAGLLGMPHQGRADIFYAASGSNGVNGNLYTLDSSTGTPTLVAPLLDSSLNPYGMTGLAFQPGTGALYGSTANSSPTSSAHLVLIDRSTGQVSDIGLFGVGATMSDITFTSDGTLYGWHAAGNHSLYRINLATGAATLVGTSDVSSQFGGGALAASLSGTIFATPDSATNPPGTLRTVDRTTGLTTYVGTLSGAPLMSGSSIIINSMDFSSSGVLYGINSNQFPANTHLVRIDTSTAAITDVGPSANFLDGLAILRQPASVIPEPSTLALAGVALASLALVRLRRRWPMSSAEIR